MGKNGKEIVTVRDAGSFIKQVTEETLQVREGYECNVVRGLDEGQCVEGIYCGAGPDIETTNPVTGEVRTMPTVKLEVTAGLFMNIPEASQLSRLRKVAPGKRVSIARLSQVKTRRGFNCNDYKIDIETDAHFIERGGHLPQEKSA